MPGPVGEYVKSIERKVVFESELIGPSDLPKLRWPIEQADEIAFQRNVWANTIERLESKWATQPRQDIDTLHHFAKAELRQVKRDSPYSSTVERGVGDVRVVSNERVNALYRTAAANAVVDFQFAHKEEAKQTEAMREHTGPRMHI